MEPGQMDRARRAWPRARRVREDATLNAAQGGFRAEQCSQEREYVCIVIGLTQLTATGTICTTEGTSSFR